MREFLLKNRDRAEVLRRAKSLDLSSLNIEELCLLSLDDLEAARRSIVKIVVDSRISEATKASSSGPDHLSVITPQEMESFLIEVFSELSSRSPSISTIAAFASSRYPKLMTEASLFLRKLLHSDTSLAIEGRKILLCHQKDVSDPIFEVSVGSCGYLIKVRDVKTNIGLLSSEKAILKNHVAEMVRGDLIIGLFSLLDQSFEVKGVSNGSSEVTKSLVSKGDFIFVDNDEIGMADKVRKILSSALGSKSTIKKVVRLIDSPEGIKYQLASPAFSVGDNAFGDQKAKVAALAAMVALLAADGANASTQNSISDALVSSATEASSLSDVRAPSVFADIVESDLGDLKRSLDLVFEEGTMGSLSEEVQGEIRIHIEQLMNRRDDLRSASQETPIVKIKDIACNISRVADKILNRVDEGSALATKVRYSKIKAEEVFESLSNRRVFGDFRR